MISGKAWTDTEDAKLIAMTAAGHRRQEIATALDRPLSSIRSRLLVLDMLPAPSGEPSSRSEWTDAEDQLLLAKFACRIPARTIANDLGRAQSSIYARYHRLMALARKAADPLPSEEVPEPVTPRQVVRKCICCPRTFLSEGPHNRMCNRCRTASASVSPFAPHSCL